MPPEEDPIAKLNENIANGSLRPERVEQFWMSRRTGTYYKKHFADELIPVLESMLEEGDDPKPREFRYSKFPRYTKKTLLTKISQSWMFLRDKMDPTGKYRKLWDITQLTPRATGILLHYIHTKAVEPMQADVVDDVKITFKWKEEMEKFLEEGQVGEKFQKTGLSLTQEQQDDIKNSFVGLEGVHVSVSETTVKVLKFNPESVEKLVETKGEEK